MKITNSTLVALPLILAPTVIFILVFRVFVALLMLQHFRGSTAVRNDTFLRYHVWNSPLVYPCEPLGTNCNGSSQLFWSATAVISWSFYCPWPIFPWFSHFRFQLHSAAVLPHILTSSRISSSFFALCATIVWLITLQLKYVSTVYGSRSAMLLN